MNRTYEDSGDSGEDNISDQQAVDQATQNPQSNLKNPASQHGEIPKSGVKI